MTKNIAILLLAGFIAWTWVVPTVESVKFHYTVSASARVCWYDTDGDGLSDSGYKGYPTVGWDWRYGRVTEKTYCPPAPQP